MKLIIERKTYTGLKKCKPPNLSCRLQSLAIAVIGNDDVLLVRIV